MEIYEANMLKVKDDNTGEEYIVESREHCDLLWNTNETAIAGNYCFYGYPEDMGKLDFNIWETKQTLYFTVLEYSFDYGKTWSKYSKAEG